MIAVQSELHTLAKKYLKKVRKSGPTNVMALCPFHMKADGSEEKKPSFALSLQNGLWFCHSCQASGNLYTFLRDMGLSRVQIDITYKPLIEAAQDNSPERLDPLKPKAIFSDSPIEESLLGVFDYYPKDLIESGYLPATLNHFGVGFDMQHLRATYPLRDLVGNLVGISGRAVTDSWPKYKVYDKEFPTWGIPERLEPDKRGLLWNAHALYPQLFFQTAPQYIVVVEGFKACMKVWQAGEKNVVALLGTYLSREHQWILERLGAEVRLFLDNNTPGITGTLKAANRLKKSLRVRVVSYPDRLIENEDAQPDDCTPEEIQQQVQSATEYFSWLAQ